jgi:hypothetical protein
VQGCFSLGIKIRQYPPVLAQQPMNIPYEIVRIAVQPVIVIVPALVRAEFFISTATESISAIETFPFHSAKVLINIQKNVFKRIQTTINGSETGISN